MRHSTSIDGLNRHLTEIEEELSAATPRRSESYAFSRSNSLRINDGTDEKLYLAVGKEYRESKPTLLWALRKSRRTKKFVLLHIHRPSQMIPFMGGWFHTSQLKAEQIEKYRIQEKEKMNETLDDYMFICEIAKVQAEKLVIEMDDVAKGLVELIAQHGITRLVMGTGAGKYYTKRIRAPISKTACTVLKDALPSCNVWFIRKGNLICTRKDSLDAYAIPQSPLASPSARGASKLRRSRSASHASWPSDQDLFEHVPRTGSGESLGETAGYFHKVESNGTSDSLSLFNVKENLIALQEEVSGQPEVSDPSMSSGADGAGCNSRLNLTRAEEGRANGKVSMNMHSVDTSKEDTELSTSLVQLGESSVDDDWNIHLQQAITEATNLVSGAYKESYRRCRAERDAFEANQRMKALELNHAKEIKLREEVEQILAREKVELEKLKTQLDDVLEELQDIRKQKAILKDRITESDGLVKDLEEKLSALKNVMNSLQKERDVAIKETKELRRTKEVPNSSTNRSTNFLEFSYLELEQATCNFESSLKIGEGGSGSVYKGYIRHTKVAIKVLDTDSLQDGSDFRQEVDNLSRLRHPNLVTLIGACPEAFTLVYEFLPNGSLEDRLSCKNNTPPLPWQIRIRISAEICSALIFLHSNKPNTVVHGDLRPANILLDVNFVSKLSDFSISRLLVHSTTSLYNWTDPKGIFVYTDPEFFSTGEIRPHSDIYSFGIILLRLLTGRPALGIVKEVQEALEKGRLQKILDPAAGDWPFKQAQQLALLGLKCCEMKRKNRPDLVGEVLKILEPIKLRTWA